jgi:TnpA family transposase
MYILDGLLEHQTQLRPVEVMADTAGVSDVVFGLFWLLGYQFSPRLADIGEARFWRLDPTADYGILNSIARSQVNAKLIMRNWDDLLRVAGSLQQGKVSASELMRSILRSRKPSTLARAIGALGRVPRTLYMLSYIDDENYRRRILTQLNRGESRHGVARAVFHGNEGSSGSATVRGRKINSARSGSWSMRSCCGIPFIWRRLSTSCGLKTWRSNLKTLPAYRLSSTNTLIFRGGTPSPCQNPLRRVGFASTP